MAANRKRSGVLHTPFRSAFASRPRFVSGLQAFHDFGFAALLQAAPGAAPTALRDLDDARGARACEKVPG